MPPFAREPPPKITRLEIGLVLVAALLLGALLFFLYAG